MLCLSGFELNSRWVPLHLVSLRAMASNVPPEPATEEAIVDCVAFFYEEGKGGENFRKKNKFRCKVKREERSLQKLKNSVWYFSWNPHIERSLSKQTRALSDLTL